MKIRTTLLTLALLIQGSAMANEANLINRITALEQRVTELESRINEVSGASRWKDVALWQRIKKEMSEREVRVILGSPDRKERSIFTTWYYHPTSRLHSFVWFDEGVVLGWEAPD